MTHVRYGNCNAVDVIEMPLAFSISIQSDTVERRPALPCTAPASVMALACSASASVSVDLPASGWLMTANVRRRPASRVTSAVDSCTALVVTGARLPSTQRGHGRRSAPRDARGQPADPPAPLVGRGVERAGAHAGQPLDVGSRQP